MRVRGDFYSKISPPGQEPGEEMPARGSLSLSLSPALSLTQSGTIGARVRTRVCGGGGTRATWRIRGSGAGYLLYEYTYPQPTTNKTLPGLPGLHVRAPLPGLRNPQPTIISPWATYVD